MIAWHCHDREGGELEVKAATAQVAASRYAEMVAQDAVEQYARERMIYVTVRPATADASAESEWEVAIDFSVTVLSVRSA